MGYTFENLPSATFCCCRLVILIPLGACFRDLIQSCVCADPTTMQYNFIRNILFPYILEKVSGLWNNTTYMYFTFIYIYIVTAYIWRVRATSDNYQYTFGICIRVKLCDIQRYLLCFLFMAYLQCYEQIWKYAGIGSEMCGAIQWWRQFRRHFGCETRHNPERVLLFEMY